MYDEDSLELKLVDFNEQEHELDLAIWSGSGPVEKEARAKRRERILYYKRKHWGPDGERRRNWKSQPKHKDSVPLSERLYVNTGKEKRTGHYRRNRIHNINPTQTVPEQMSGHTGNPISDYFGMDEDMLCPAVIQCYDSRKRRWEPRKNWRSKKVMKSRLNWEQGMRRRIKRIYKERYRWYLDNKILGGKGNFTGKSRARTQMPPSKDMEKEEVMSGDFLIKDTNTLYRACDYIQNGGKPQWFHHDEPIMNALVHTMLRYVRSCYDRRIDLDIGKVLNLSHPVVNGRISKWEYTHNLKIITLSQAFRGIFSSEDGKTSRRLYLPIGKGETYYVSKNYDGVHYVTNQKELKVAIRAILKGTMDEKDYWCVDPKTGAVLQFCQELRDTLYGGDLSPNELRIETQKIFGGRNQELEWRLKEKGFDKYYCYLVWPK